MRVRSLLTMLLGALGIQAQSSTTSQSAASQTSSPASSSGANSSQLVTTILTTISPTSSGASPITTSFVLTIALNNTLSPSAIANSSSSTTFPNGTTIYTNGTTVYADGTKVTSNGTVVAANGTTIVNGTAEIWNGTQTWLPFKIRIDGAYGAGGAVLMLSGGFVGVLGGKHRWSSMAIVSGYSVLLFTLVLILRFGVEAKMLPPSPQYPTATERGLYCLASVIAAIIGSGIGLFFYKYTRYWVCAMGGFALGWFIMACKAGGVTGNSIVGRWGLIGGLSVVSFIVGLLPRWHHHLLLLSTAFIGSTALVLGIDCFSRAGLKEFYIWNLGFRDLFPKVEGYKYPLLTIMQVELGVLAACFLIGTAIQYRVLGKLHVKLIQVQAEEDARREAKEEAQAAAHFSRMEKDLESWEGKYGNNKGGIAAAMEEGFPLATLAKDSRPDSTVSLMRRTTSGYEHGSNGAISPITQPDGESARSANFLPPMQLGDSIGAATGIPATGGINQSTTANTEDVERLRLMREIEDTKKSIEALRTSTPANSAILAERPTSSVAHFDSAQSRRQSALSHGSRLSTYQPEVTTPLESTIPNDISNREWQEYLADRKLFTPPSGVTPPIESSVGRLSKIPDAVVEAMNRRERTVSAYELGASATLTKESPSTTTDPRPNSTTPYTRRHSSLDVTAPPLARPALAATIARPQSGYRQPPIVTGHADSPLLRKSSEVRGVPAEDAHRTITFEELGARHRARLSKLQQPVTEEMQNSLDLAAAKARYDKNREAEKRTAAKKAAESAVRGKPTSPSRVQRETQAAAASGPESSMLANIPQESGMTKAAQWTRRQSSMQFDRAPVDLAPPVGERSTRQRGQAEVPRERPVPRQRYSSGPNKVVN
ncbi:hypothetical protein NliqN6_4777 [Naganishia liquefaciens]|uniref:TM7S3/TM198-like domain-containing protein n=1 Tax=Naganishia liquefaciens TaxID=104408 RepID=A0A8H3YG33_9TREE|nr:hypothetical protein NliqN6_4777 [Naganishia liquefaciens]